MTKKMGPNMRAFTVVSSSQNGKKGGRYIAETPMDAGRKAGKRLLDDGPDDVQSVEFEMQEVTRETKVAHAKAQYFYKVTRALIPAKDRVVKVFKKPDGTKTEFVAKYTYTTVAIGPVA
jgi:hypothetical protein